MNSVALMSSSISGEKPILTADYLRTVLRYEPETGLFFWLRLARNHKARAGERIGGTIRSGYLRITIDGMAYSAHRLAFIYMLGRDPIEEVDHINRIRDDNRWVNLREVSRAENMQNKSAYRNKRTSSLMGVSWWSRGSCWKAQIQTNGKKKGLGYFSTEQAAYDAYLVAKRALHPMSLEVRNG